MRASEKPVKLYIIQKVLTRAIQKCEFYKLWVIRQKLRAFKWNFGILPQALTRYG